MIKKIGLVFSFSLLVGCATRVTPPAQIVNVTQAENIADNAVKPTTAVVAKQNTTTSQQTKIMPLNNNENTQNTTKSNTKESNPNKHNNASATTKSADSVVANNTGNSNGWIMPTKGTISGTYSATRKGIDISGNVGQAVYAANNGKVVYSGNGLKGYGNLIIIKHPEGYLTAYAHNKMNLVNEGDSVKRGQKIAEMGQSNGGGSLHFEVRKNGKPINPNSIIGG